VGAPFLTIGLAVALLLPGLSFSALAAGKPRIVNGVPATSFPAVGALLTSFTPVSEYCSGTLIGCRTFAVAAHCVCAEGDLDANECLAHGLDDPSVMRVFFQHAGFFDVESLIIDPTFAFESGGDIALLTLTAPVTGIRPARLDRAGVRNLGTAATLVGFGVTSEDGADTGVKRVGDIVTDLCPGNVNAAKHICWSFTEPVGQPGTDSNTCAGDSGGPLFFATPMGPVLAGVTSGGEPGCEADSVSWNTDVFAHLAFIDDFGGRDVGREHCDGLPQVGGAGTTQFTPAGELSRSRTTARFSFEVPAGTSQLRVALNGEDNDSSVGTQPPNDFDLYVKAAEAPTRSEFDCADTTIGPYGFCQIQAPASGTWHVLVQHDAGGGLFQLTVTTFAAAPCAGDCDASGQVTVDEILTGVNIALGETEVTACANLDVDADAAVTVDELIQAIDRALTGCSGV